MTSWTGSLCSIPEAANLTVGFFAAKLQQAGGQCKAALFPNGP